MSERELRDAGPWSEEVSDESPFELIQKLDLSVHLPRALYRFRHTCRATQVSESIYRINWFCRVSNAIVDSRFVRVVYADGLLCLTDL